MICSSWTVTEAKPMRRSVAANMPIRIALLRCPSGSPAAASPITIALSPASTRSIMMTWKSAVMCCEEINSSIRATPLMVQSDIAVRLNCQRGPGLDVRRKRRSQTAEKCFPLLRLVREGEEPDHLVRLDQNGEDNADERQAPGEVEPHDAEAITPAEQREAGRHCGNDKEQGDDCGRQCVRRHYVPDSKRRDQRNQQNGREQLLAPRSGRPVAGWDNVAAVQEGHRILIRELELW